MTKCPVCGSSSIELKPDEFIVKTIVLRDLQSYQCSTCKEGFYDQESNNKIQEAIDEMRATQ